MILNLIINYQHTGVTYFLLQVGVPKGWSSMPIFVVGTATAEAGKLILFPPPCPSHELCF